MGTQAVISVVKKGKTLLKVVTGMSGQQAPAFAERLKEEILTGGLPAVEAVYDLASECGLGGPESLVVMSHDGSVAFKGDGELGPLYQDSFGDPRFNPRWCHGTADFIEVVEI